MRIEPLKPATLPAQESTAVTDQRVPQSAVPSNWKIAALPPLELGQEIDALVAQEMPGERLLLNVGGVLVDADNPGGLSVGQHLHLRVEQLQPQIVLHITLFEPTIESAATRLLRAHVPFYPDAGESLQNLLEQLALYLESSNTSPTQLPKLGRLRELITTWLSQKTPPTVERLLTLINKGGLHYEARLFRAADDDPAGLQAIAAEDLKGLLLGALQEAEISCVSTGLQSGINGQLANIESQQAVNLLAQQEGGAFQLQIPFFNGSGFSTAALSVEPDEKGWAKERGKCQSGYKILFLLDLENFGRTRIDAHWKAKDLGVIFYVEQERSRDLINQELPRLRATLEAMGYREVWLVAKVLKEMPLEKQDKFALLALGAPAGTHLLDTTA